MRTRGWYLYPIGAAVATAIYLAPHAMGPEHQTISYLFNLIGLSSPILILMAVRVHRPERRTPWLLFAIGQMLFICGDVIAYNYESFSRILPGFSLTPDGGTPFPSWGDPLYLAVYPCLIGGVLLLIRSRTAGRDRASFIDALMLAIGTAALSWVLLISPLVQADTPIVAKLVSMAYPIMDLLLVAALIRLSIGTGRRSRSFYLMVAAILALFTTDAIYGWMGLHTPYQPGTGYLEIGWIAFYVLWGMAALHPSMRVMSEPTPEVETKLTKTRLTLLACVSLIAPILMAFQAEKGSTSDVNVLIGATIAMFVLVVVRMWGLVRSQQHSATREKALRQAGAALVTATSREGINSAAIEAARSLAGADAAIRMCDMPGGNDDFEVVAAVGGTLEAVGVWFPFSGLPQWKRERLRENDSYLIRTYEGTLIEELGLPSDHEGSVFVAPLFIRDELRGLMIVATATEMPRTVGDSLRALSSQVALALESAALTEDLLLQQSEKRFASLVQNSSDIVNVIDADTSVRYASPSAARVLGLEPAAMEGTKFSALIHPDDKTRVLSFLTSTGEGEGHTGLIEYRICHRDGHYVFVETLRTNLMHDANVRGIVLNTRDIGERREFEEQLSHQAFHDSITGPGEPRSIPRPRDPRDRAAGARQQADRGSVRGPRRLQDDQRLSWATSPATRSLPKWASGSRASCVRRTRRRAWAATSSRSCWKTAERGSWRPTSPSGSRRCWLSRSCLKARRSSCGRASGSRSPTGSSRATPRSSFATRTSRCIWPRNAARVASRCSSPPCTTRH